MVAVSKPPALVCAVKSTALPPGRTCGQRWVTSPFANSVTGVGGPPAEEMRERPPEGERATTRLPSSPQLPPRGLPVSHNDTVAPPSTEIFFNFPCAKNATHCPSGEKKG